METDHDIIAEDQARSERLTSRHSKHDSDFSSYSRFVRIMRLALPLAAMVIVAVLFLRSGLEERTIEPISQDSPEIRDQHISKNELLNPKFESMDKANRPYKITADRAVQGEKNKELIMLDRPVGVIDMGDNVNVTMRSDTGAYRQDTERFFLQGNVFLQHDDGYSLSSSEAHIDLKQSFAWSDKDVQGDGDDLYIIAKGVRANGKTGKIVFVGPAKLVLESGFGGVKK